MVKQTDNSYRGEFRHDIRFGSSGAASQVRAVRQAARRVSEVRFTGTGPFRQEELTKIFKVKAGQKYKPIKTRKGSRRLTNFLLKKG